MFSFRPLALRASPVVYGFLAKATDFISVNLPCRKGREGACLHPLFSFGRVRQAVPRIAVIQRKPFQFTLWGQPHPSPFSDVSVFDVV